MSQGDLLNEILTNSSSKSYDKAKNEWIFMYCEYKDNVCICGQRIFQNCIIKNIITSKILIVGSTCVESITGFNYKNIFQGIKSLESNTVPNKEFLEHCLIKNYISNYEYNFLTNMKNKRIFSKKQKKYKDDILSKLKIVRKF